MKQYLIQHCRHQKFYAGYEYERGEPFFDDKKEASVYAGLKEVESEIEALEYKYSWLSLKLQSYEIK